MIWLKRIAPFRSFLYLALLCVFGLNIILVGHVRSALAEKNKAEQEASRPANLELVFLEDFSCEDCFPMKQSWADVRKSLSVEITEEKDTAYDSEEGKTLVEQYKIKKIPALIIRGEIDKANVAETLAALGTRAEDALLVNPARPVYVDAKSGDVIGRSDLRLITDNACSDCYDPMVNQSILKDQYGVSFSHVEKIDVDSTEGKQLVDAYHLTRVPTFILSSEAAAYPRLAQIWKGIGTIEDDGSLVFRDVAVLGKPYFDLEAQRLQLPVATSTKP